MWCIVPQTVILGTWAAVPSMRAWQVTSGLAAAMLVAAITFPVLAWWRLGRGSGARVSACVLICGWVVALAASVVLFLPVFKGDQ